ncbi:MULTISPECIES: molybdate ABC transporter substrate-binding protein [unclassified Nocardia]|uniref:molybdate ABC transporter substrate-binding protein n=1 Tax=unclassified Nocardia TaxID=2637762 RepID=UPI001CE4B3B3|nr:MULTISPECIES: molybdate ABC transporter substrate-binding protein [unclassified Nocardia]
MNRVVAASVVGALAAVVVTGCGSDDSGKSGSDTGTVTVYAAASLKQVFTDLAEQFEADHPGAKVQFSFAGSSDLAAQINQGAPADVFAAADPVTMDTAVKGGRITEATQNFATNVLTIVTAPGNPKHIAGLRDLTQPGLQLVVCAAPVPCGRATKKVTDAAGVALKPVSEEQSVTDVLTKVTSGQADAGVVYVTDAASAGAKVATVSMPESAAAVNTYPIAVLKDSKQEKLAHEFEGLVTGPKGRAALQGAGFGAP